MNAKTSWRNGTVRAFDQCGSWNRNRNLVKGRFNMKPITPENSKMGFIGIGYRGLPIARRLLQSGFKLVAYDRDRAKAEELIPFRGTVAESVAELSSTCDVLLSCLPTDEAVLSICRGADGAFHIAHRASLALDLRPAFPHTLQQSPATPSVRPPDHL